MTIGGTIKQARSQRGLGLREAARGIGISYTFLSEVESGRKYPSPETLSKMCRFYELDYVEMCNELKFCRPGYGSSPIRLAVIRRVMTLTDDQLAKVLKAMEQF